ncbi:MAG: riboflavin biosynthesis protein RibF [Ruminococcus sp.]|nr:riboflavin biosynthesis protein RibF [Ruminococcus sp.]
MEQKKTAVALGLFDGVHLGHRAVISRPAEMASGGLVPTVFTFRNTSLSFKQGRRIEYIYTDSYKERLIRSLGIEDVISEDFSSLKDLSGEDFAGRILSERLCASCVVCGRDFRFGRNASCGITELAELGKRFGFTAELAEDVTADGENVSSNRIRELLSNGRPEKAAQLLGAEYTIYGKAVHGKQIGRTIDFPTVNQLFEAEQLVPLYGVYASAVNIDGREYRAVTNIGVKPTIEGERAPLAETHILGFTGDLYGETLEIRIKRFIRSERKFSSLDELKAQISADILKADI